MPTPNTAAPYELFAQREMNALAAKTGILRAELQIVRCTLSALQPSLGDWQRDEIRTLIVRIDDVLAEKS